MRRECDQESAGTAVQVDAKVGLHVYCVTAQTAAIQMKTALPRIHLHVKLHPHICCVTVQYAAREMKRLFRRSELDFAVVLIIRSGEVFSLACTRPVSYNKYCGYQTKGMYDIVSVKHRLNIAEAAHYQI